MKKLTTFQRNSLIFLLILVVVLVIGYRGYIFWKSSDLNPVRSQLRQQYAQDLLAALHPDAKNEVKIRGVVTHVGMGCESGPQSCHFILQFNDLPVSVYYQATQGPTCPNAQAVQAAQELNNGDVVEVFGKYYAVGSISTCDSPAYYVRRQR